MSSFSHATRPVQVFGSKDIECVIAPMGAIRTSVGKLSAAGQERWGVEAVAQYQEKLVEGAEERKDGFQCVRVHQSSGGSSVFLFLDPKVSAFELQTELRRVFEDVFSLREKPGAPLLVRFDLRLLDAAGGKRVLHALSVLHETSGWKPVMYGNREAERRRAPPGRELKLEVISKLKPAEAARVVRKGALLGEANNLVRTLAALPANELNPEKYRERVEQLAKERGLQFEFWDREELTKQGAGAFLAVARADGDFRGGIARIRYRPKRPRKPGKAGKGAAPALPFLALVGKGICFDTGGYNVKTGSSMLGMHGDMTGSALAMALCAYYAALEVDFEVRAYLALSENLISPTAYKPNEVVIACDGTSIEVVDTDAEGRMILSDTLALVRRETPALVIDFATLTGAAIRALDTRRGAVFSNRPQFLDLALRAGDSSGERIWCFPIGGDYRKELKSKHADILQCSSSSNADHIYAATFLSHFIGAETPWVHLDLVPAENKGGLGIVGSDTTGFGVLWTEAFVERVWK